MSDNKLVKTVIAAAALTGFAEGHRLGGKKSRERELHLDPSSSAMNYSKVTAVMAGRIALKQYLEILQYLEKGLCYINCYTVSSMASVLMMIGGAVLNAAAFTGGNYLAKSLVGDSDEAALEEKKRHDEALEAYQAAYAKYMRYHTTLLHWIATKAQGQAELHQH